MKRHPQTLGTALALAVTLAATAAAQDRDKALVPLKVQIVISRYQGEKRVSSLPYTLSVNANDPNRTSQLRMGAQIPVTSTSYAAADNKAPLTSYQYRDIGTNIDCGASTADDGRFRLTVSIDDSAVIGDETKPATVNGAPVFRSFRVTETLLLKDGQSIQFTTATDKVTGDTIKVDVTLTVVK